MSEVHSGAPPARARKGYPQSSALRRAPLVQTKGLSTLAALRCKPWVIPLPLQLLPPQAWAWAKALLCEQQQHGHLRATTKEKPMSSAAITTANTVNSPTTNPNQPQQ